MAKLKNTLLLFISIGFSNMTYAVDPFSNTNKADEGWHFGKDPILEKKKKEKEQEMQQQQSPPEQKKEEIKEAQKPKEDKCKKAESWERACGFVDPGNDYEFQAKQRDALLQGMSMTKNDPEVVKQFQYYMNWVTNQAVKVANMWQYNMLQSPELDPTLKLPTNSFGINLMEETIDKEQKDFFASLKDISKLVYFSRDDCAYCHSFVGILRQLSKDTKLSYSNIPLDKKCMMEKENCLVTDKAEQVAGMLNVTVVPTLYLYVEPNLWIKISHGVVDVATLKARIKNFVMMYKNALKKGISRGGKSNEPAIDFSGDDTPIGSKNVEPIKKATLPTEADIKALFSGGK